VTQSYPLTKKNKNQEQRNSHQIVRAKEAKRQKELFAGSNGERKTKYEKCWDSDHLIGAVCRMRKSNPYYSANDPG
jgi:hypothetical protein